MRHLLVSAAAIVVVAVIFYVIGVHDGLVLR